MLPKRIHWTPARRWQASRNMADKHIEGVSDIFFCFCDSTPAPRDCDFFFEGSGLLFPLVTWRHLWAAITLRLSDVRNRQRCQWPHLWCVMGKIYPALHLLLHLMAIIRPLSCFLTAFNLRGLVKEENYGFFCSFVVFMWTQTRFPFDNQADISKVSMLLSVWPATNIPDRCERITQRQNPT